MPTLVDISVLRDKNLTGNVMHPCIKHENKLLHKIYLGACNYYCEA